MSMKQTYGQSKSLQICVREMLHKELPVDENALGTVRHETHAGGRSQGAQYGMFQALWTSLTVSLLALNC